MTVKKQTWKYLKVLVTSIHGCSCRSSALGTRSWMTKDQVGGPGPARGLALTGLKLPEDVTM